MLDYNNTWILDSDYHLIKEHQASKHLSETETWLVWTQVSSWKMKSYIQVNTVVPKLVSGFWLNNCWFNESK
jgi:hypothetical protein